MNNIDVVKRAYWIFDLDGTLTIPAHDFAAIKRELGFPLDCDILRHLETLPPEEQRAKRLQLDRIEEEIASRARQANGADDLLKTLSERGVSMGILTRNSKDNALITLGAIGLLDYFDHVCVLGREETLPKPDPQGIHHLLDHWGAEPDNAVMVGDYLYDLLTAKAAGVGSVHLDTHGDFAWPEHTDLGVTSLANLHEHYGQSSPAVKHD
jgi:HAD superfamily hydrolase (TIGR01549 family)